MIKFEESRGPVSIWCEVGMPGSDGQETEEVAYADQHQDPARPRSRAEALIHTLSQYQDVYPVLQRGIQFLYQELSDGIAADKDDQEIKDCIGSFIATGALVGTVDAMLANLDSPAFIASCFELLLGMLNIAEDIVASSILKNGKTSTTTGTTSTRTSQITNPNDNALP